ncbi:hypothetical protein JB92DRAFT_3135746 [Gautieria morchelliformis]|nr:hypothetical protein JB92DRAFT_3135746 [Gautieria morchelliformis]
MHIQLVSDYHLPVPSNSPRETQSTSQPIITYTFILQAARQSVHKAIVAEFGNPDLTQAFSAETLEDNVPVQESQHEEAGPSGIEVDEFPWVTGLDILEM